MSLRDFDELPAESAHVVREYLERVRGSLCFVVGPLADETVEDVSQHLLETLSPSDGLAEVEAALAELGEPDEYAALLCDALEPAAEAVAVPEATRVLGVPYEFRVPSAQRIAARWWDPANPSVFVPRVFGIGWDLNFGALAVKFGLIEPDAQDEPFESTPDRAFVACLMLPVCLLGGIIGSYALFAASLPATLPVHWGINGRADNFAPAMWAFLPLMLFATAATIWAAYAVALRRPKLLRGAVIGLAAFVSGLSAGIWALTLLSAAGLERVWLPPVMVLLGAVAAPMAVLTVLARSGRRAEIERDLGGAVQR